MCIDLFYQHRVDPDVPIEDVAGAVKDLIRRRQGEALRAFRSRACKRSVARTQCSRSPRCKANIRSGGESPKRKYYRRSKNSASVSFHTALWAGAFSRERWTKTPPSTARLPQHSPSLYTRGTQSESGAGRSVRPDRKTEEGDTCPDRARLAAGSEAVDCSNSRDHETEAPRRKYWSSLNRTYARRSPPHRKRCIKNLCARSPIPGTH